MSYQIGTPTTQQPTYNISLYHISSYILHVEWAHFGQNPTPCTLGKPNFQHYPNTDKLRELVYGYSLSSGTTATFLVVSAWLQLFVAGGRGGIKIPLNILKFFFHKHLNKKLV